MRFSKILILAALAVALVSCEGNTDRVRLVANNSSSQLSVVASTQWYPDIGLSVNEGETEAFFTSSQLGGSDYVIHPYSEIDTLIITNEAGDTCTINYSDSLQWDVVVTERSRVPADWLHEYTLVVTDEDF